MPIDELFAEAERQLTICNACRYCEGYCAVFPALERRAVLSTGDMVQLANVCFDCRACFQACMYAPPHEFGVNPPQVLARVRLASYERYVWPRRVPRLLRGWSGVGVGLGVAIALTVALSVAFAGAERLLAAPGGAQSPYDILPPAVLLPLLLATSGYAVVVMACAAVAYWREVGGGRADLGWRPAWQAMRHAATLRYQRGGGDDCYYPDDMRPSAGRRRLHHLTMYGFLLCTASTLSAAVLEHLKGEQPPYPILSAPVLLGTVGGVAMVVGCTGLLRLKASSSPVTGFAQMTVKDYGFLVALDFLSVSGLLTLFTRTTPAYAAVYLAHLAAILLCFAAAPYSKFPHFVYRFLALVKDESEKAREPRR
jgi:citrate/tricarballylate utilization protein